MCSRARFESNSWESMSRFQLHFGSLQEASTQWGRVWKFRVFFRLQIRNIIKIGAIGERQITKERAATSLQIILSRKKPQTECSQCIFITVAFRMQCLADGFTCQARCLHWESLCVPDKSRALSCPAIKAQGCPLSQPWLTHRQSCGPTTPSCGLCSGLGLCFCLPNLLIV